MPAPAARHIPTDGRTIAPPNDLRSHTRAGNGPDPVAAAERALSKLSTRFTLWLDDELAGLLAARDAFRVYPDDGEARTALFRKTHDIRGHAATLGYPLVGTVAGSLCRVLDNLPAGPKTNALVESHVDTIVAIVHAKASGEGSPMAQRLVAEIGTVTEEVFKLVGTDAKG